MKISAWTLKELRQATRSRTIAISLTLFLFISLAFFYFVPVIYGFGSDTGSVTFAFEAAALAFILCVMLPADAFNRLNTELGDAKHKPDFTLMTALPPKEVIDGKLRSSYALMFFFVSAALPFCVLACFLHGITLQMIAQAILCICVVSSFAVHVALVLASIRTLARAARKALFALWAILFFMVMLALVESTHGDYSLERGDFVLLGILLNLSLILRMCAVRFISPPAAERDAALRTAVFISLAFWGAIAFFACSGDDGVFLWLVASNIIAILFAAQAASAFPGYSHRIALTLQSRHALLRPFTLPFSSFTIGGFAFAFIITALTGAIAFLCCDFANGDLDFAQTIFCGTAYIFALLLIVRFFWKFIRFFAHRATPLGNAVYAALLFALAQSIPALLSLDPTGSSSYSDFNDLPFVIDGISVDPELHWRYALAALAIGLLLNARELIRSIYAYLRAKDCY